MLFYFSYLDFWFLTLHAHKTLQHYEGQLLAISERHLVFTVFFVFETWDIKAKGHPALPWLIAHLIC